MSCAAALHQAIEQFNIFAEPTRQLNKYLTENRDLYKAALIVNHVFRAASMVALMYFLPIPALINGSICLIGSVFYRLTVEVNCAYKFALPAFGGAVAFLMGQEALIHLISRAAFASLSAFGAACIALLPLCFYATYIVLTVSYDVDHKLLRK